MAVWDCGYLLFYDCRVNVVCDRLHNNLISFLIFKMLLSDSIIPWTLFRNTLTAIPRCVFITQYLAQFVLFDGADRFAVAKLQIERMNLRAFAMKISAQFN